MPFSDHEAPDGPLVPGLFSWRLAQVERDVLKKADAEDVALLAAEMAAVRTVLNRLLVAITVAAIVFALGVLQLSLGTH